MANIKKKKLSLKALSEEAPSSEERKQIMRALLKAEDRSSAILGAAFIESDLDDLIGRKLKGGTTWEKMTDANGPLSSFSQKILIGYAMGLYDECVYRNLNLVRAIRNVFAHARKIITFDHVLVSAELSKIKLSTKKRSSLYKDLSKVKASNNNKVRWTGLCLALNNEIKVREIAILQRKLSIAKRKAKRASLV